MKVIVSIKNYEIVPKCLFFETHDFKMAQVCATSSHLNFLAYIPIMIQNWWDMRNSAETKSS